MTHKIYCAIPNSGGDECTCDDADDASIHPSYIQPYSRTPEIRKRLDRAGNILRMARTDLQRFNPAFGQSSLLASNELTTAKSLLGRGHARAALSKVRKARETMGDEVRTRGAKGYLDEAEILLQLELGDI